MHKKTWCDIKDLCVVSACFLVSFVIVGLVSGHGLEESLVVSTVMTASVFVAMTIIMIFSNRQYYKEDK